MSLSSLGAAIGAGLLLTTGKKSGGQNSSAPSNIDPRSFMMPMGNLVQSTNVRAPQASGSIKEAGTTTRKGSSGGGTRGGQEIAADWDAMLKQVIGGE